MPQVSGKSQVPRNGVNSKSDIDREMLTAKPRDDLHSAHAGDENKGPAKHQKQKHNGTKLNARRIGKNSDKEPVR